MQYSACLGMCQVWSRGLHSLRFDNRKGVGGGPPKWSLWNVCRVSYNYVSWCFPCLYKLKCQFITL